VRIFVSDSLKRQYNAAEGSGPLRKWLRQNHVAVHHVLHARVHFVVVRASEDALGTPEECAICLLPMRACAFKLACGHAFHIGCTIAQAKCALCRQSIAVTA